MFILGAHANTYLELGMPRTKKAASLSLTFLFYSTQNYFSIKALAKKVKNSPQVEAKGSFIYFENEGFVQLIFFRLKRLLGIFHVGHVYFCSRLFFHSSSFSFGELENRAVDIDKKNRLSKILGSGPISLKFHFLVNLIPQSSYQFRFMESDSSKILIY